MATKVEVESCVDSLIEALACETYDAIMSKDIARMRSLRNDLEEAERRLKGRLLTFQGRLSAAAFEKG